MSFADSLKDGGIGEIVTWNYFIHEKDVKNIVDVRDDKVFQGMDVDFLVENTDRQFTWLEVKTDFKAHETGNFVYEVSTSGNIGCFEKTKAHFIAIYVPQSGYLYMLSTKALREYVRSNDLRLVNMGDNAKGYILPISDLEFNNVIKNIFSVEKIRKVTNDNN